MEEYANVWQLDVRPVGLFVRLLGAEKVRSF